MLVDERGRVAGRFNIVDIAAAVLLFLLVPLAIAAYLLFRTPTPTLATVTPRTLLEGPNQRLEIDGTNLRPFMRVSFDTTPANSFLLGSTKYALVDVPVLPPGVYDVVLYDYAREVARLSKAVTVVPMSTDVELEVTGAFKSPPANLAAQLKAGDRLPPERPLVEIVSVGALAPSDIKVRVGSETIAVPLSGQDLAATLRIRCSTVRTPDGTPRCAVPGADQSVIVAPDALLTVPTRAGPVLFQIAAAHAPKGTGSEAR
jgi:hypothetical protein